jgi:serine/threonine-protein kinase HipA
MVGHKRTVANVYLWDEQVGSVSWDAHGNLGHFAYAEEFLQKNLEPAPMTVPLDPRRFAFPDLNANVFKGLPGFLADSLPDKFGTAIINAWLAQQGLAPDGLNPVERLCLIADKGMGALEYSPRLIDNPPERDGELELAPMVELINIMLSEPDALRSALQSSQESAAKLTEALQVLLRIGISADGSRAKAIVAWNPDTNELRTGHTRAPEGFGYWLLKFDGITGNRDRETTNDPQGWGTIEYAYHKMAIAAGITMMECRLLQENGRHHFLTRRFDRTPSGGKIHRQSLCAMGHMDFDALGAYSYEQAMDIMRDLGFSQNEIEEQFRRLVFNVIARNHDDHAKNIAFLMDQNGKWSLAPAYDLTFAYNPEGHWTHKHQMTINGKRDHFEQEDFFAVAKRFSIPTERAHTIIQEVASAVERWPEFANEAGVEPAQVDAIAGDLRLNIWP